MKTRKLLAMLMVASIAASFASCGNSSGNDTSTASKENTSSSSSSEKSDSSSSTPASTKTDSGVLAATTDVTAEDILARDYSEPIKISFAGVQVNDALDYNHGNDYYEWWTDTFNIEWDITSLTWDNWTERMNTWINADDLPDWSVWNFNAGDAANYADQGLVKCMPDDWKEQYPNLAAAASCSEANGHYEELYGGMYYFFRPVFANNFPADTITSHISMFLRTDWAEQAGVDLSKNKESETLTLSEFINYLHAVKDAGIAEYPWYNTSGYVGNVLGTITEHNGVLSSAYYKASDGQYHWGPAEAETGVKDTLRVIKQAYDDGLLYPEFYTLQDPDDIGHFYASGDAAATEYTGMAAWFDRYESNMQDNLGLSFWDTSDVFIMTDDEGKAHGDASTNFWACNILSPNMDDATYERIMSIWDYGCTEEGQLRIRLGVPDVDWKYDENGNIVNLVKDTEYGTLENKYTSLYPITGNMFILSDDYSFINPGFTERAREKVSSLYIKRAEISTAKGKTVDWDLSNYSSQAMNLATMTYADEYANIITKAGDFDTNYDQWVSDKMSMIQPVLDELNAAFCE